MMRLGLNPSVGYTLGMKTAVSIPSHVFEEAEMLAHRMKKSRSEIYSRALEEYIARHESDRITELMNRALDEAGAVKDEFASAASRHTLERIEW
jgi:metal-responsive CopG/Arc/MetJ family transcriptional regulator